MGLPDGMTEAKDEAWRHLEDLDPQPVPSSYAEQQHLLNHSAGSSSVPCLAEDSIWTQRGRQSGSELSWQRTPEAHKSEVPSLPMQPSFLSWSSWRLRAVQLVLARGTPAEVSPPAEGLEWAWEQATANPMPPGTWRA